MLKNLQRKETFARKIHFDLLVQGFRNDVHEEPKIVFSVRIFVFIRRKCTTKFVHEEFVPFKPTKLSNVNEIMTNWTKCAHISHTLSNQRPYFLVQYQRTTPTLLVHKQLSNYAILFCSELYNTQQRQNFYLISSPFFLSVYALNAFLAV